ncbi:unnamed protein product, partial [Ectocarpus fasciculatus]
MSGGVALLVKPARRISASICRRLPREACLQPGLRPTTVITPQRYHRNNSSRSRRSGGWDSMPLAPGASILLTVALCSVSADSPAEAGWWPFSNRQPASPFSNTIPRKAKKQRAKAEVQMRKYLAKMRKPVQELMAGLRKGEVSREEYDRRMAVFNDEVELATHRIIFGVSDPPDARRRYEAEHGNCRYTPEAIRLVSALSPLIEIGAGRGHWQRGLSEAGATVISFDKWATTPSSGNESGTTAGLPQIGRVLPGDEHALRLHRDKTLLLVYPPPGDMALHCLHEYRGDTLVYVGEGRGGANASDAFFDGLDAEWDVESILDLDPFPQCFERLFLLRRRQRTAVGASSHQD